MRIVQITDLHINTTSETVNGIDTRANFIKTLNRAVSQNPDMLVLSGDLSFHSGNFEIYNWIKTVLKSKLLVDFHIIGGNHDDINTLAEVFELKDRIRDDELFYSIGEDIFFLDTIKGFCNHEQWNWFLEKISGTTNEHPVIFMHHPPFKAGVPHMDNKYSFQQSDIFEKIIVESGKQPYVFCGHYHNEITIARNGISVFITPSTYLQISSASEEFEIEHSIPAYRIIDIDNNVLKTSVKYVFD
ncbi:MAG: metallophosphoesterase [Deltaproteobacteria bacterium]